MTAPSTEPRAAIPVCEGDRIRIVGEHTIRALRDGNATSASGVTLIPADDLTRLDDLMRDAARYRWLRATERSYHEVQMMADWLRDGLEAEALDAKIDAEIAREEGR